MPFAIAAYVLWGIFPAFFPLLTPAAPLEIIGHRIVWTAVVMSIIMSCTKTGWSELRRASVRTWGWLGQPPVQALMLAFSFGFYGLVKKRVDMSAMASLTAETLILAPVAAGYLLVLEARGTGTFGHISVGHSLLLMTAGLVTAVPLLLFGIAARRIQLSTIGMLQYLTPTMQMLWAVFVTREEIAPLRWVAFGIIWVAVALYFLDILRFRSTNGRRKASTG
jgi:protein rarD